MIYSYCCGIDWSCGGAGKSEKTKAMHSLQIKFAKQYARMSTTQTNECPLEFSPEVKNASAVAVLANM